jgi:protein arginine N-methyltransferase 5
VWASSSYFISRHVFYAALVVHKTAVTLAHTWQYDMLTTPITNDNFHSRVLSLLRSYTNATEGSAQAQPLPLIPALENVDTPLVPDNLLSQLVAFTSSWIDLGSPDPVVAHLSRQVFHLEIAYAAFCGVVNIVVPGPRVANGTNGIAQYARAVKEALLTGAYVQLHILMPVDHSKAPEEEDLGNLARFVRPEHAQATIHQPTATFAAWDAWNTIRTICKYNSRLSVGKISLPPLTYVLARKVSAHVHAVVCFSGCRLRSWAARRSRYTCWPSFMRIPIV